VSVTDAAIDEFVASVREPKQRLIDTLAGTPAAAGARAIQVGSSTHVTSINRCTLYSLHCISS
jgi:hypothetical protein